MPKRKPQVSKAKIADLQEFLNSYDIQTLRGAVLSFDNSTGWEIMKAYISTVQRRYEVDALDLIGKGDQAPAAYASGYAKCLDELKNSFVEGLQQTILGRSQVIENIRPEE